jgi:hypothetical protein
VVASIGPWNPTAVALGSQLDRLQDLLVEGGLVRKGRLALQAPAVGFDPAQVESLQSTIRDPPGQSLEVTAPDASTIRLPLRPVTVTWADEAPRDASHFTIERAASNHRARLIVGRLIGTWPYGSDDYVVATLEALLLVD